LGAKVIGSFTPARGRSEDPPYSHGEARELREGDLTQLAPEQAIFGRAQER